MRKNRMKTLIFNGSPRKNGETAYMIHTLQENLGGEYKWLMHTGTDSSVYRLQMVF